MLFRRQRKRSAPPGVRGAGPSAPRASNLYPIDFEMMVKGHVVERRGGKVRQYTVSIGGTSKLVTSGDVVDRQTYEALLAAGAIQVAPDTAGGTEE